MNFAPVIIAGGAAFAGARYVFSASTRTAIIAAVAVSAISIWIVASKNSTLTGQ